MYTEKAIGVLFPYNISSHQVWTIGKKSNECVLGSRKKINPRFLQLKKHTKRENIPSDKNFWKNLLGKLTFLI